MEEEALKRIDTQGLIKLAQRLIQIRTVNPAADYSEISRHLHETLHAPSKPPPGPHGNKGFPY